MSKLSKNDLAKKAFKENPGADKVCITSDGFPFLTENAAHLHATTNASGKTLNVTIFKREAKPEKPVAPNKDKATNPIQAAKDRADAIAKLATVEEVEKALKDETAKSVKEAGANRISELNAPNRD